MKMKNLISKTSQSIFVLTLLTTLCHIINACNFHPTYATLNQMKNQQNRSNKIFFTRFFEFSGSMNHRLEFEKGQKSGRSTRWCEQENEANKRLTGDEIDFQTLFADKLSLGLCLISRVRNLWENLWKSNLFFNFLSWRHVKHVWWWK